MLSVTTISRGIVIDHIKQGLGYEIFKVLQLDAVDFTVALIMNAQSTKLGRKDMIKIDGVVDFSLADIGIIDPDVTICIIEDQKITKKIKAPLPEVIVGTWQCTNPKCISTAEREVESHFTLIDRSRKIYRCDYCEHYYNMEE